MVLRVWSFSVEAGMIDVPIKGPLAANGLFFLRQAAIRGMGIVMLPNWAVADAIANGELTPLFKEFPTHPSSTPISAVFSTHHSTAPKVRTFVDYFAKRIRERVEVPRRPF